MDGEVLVAVAALVGTDHHGFDDELFVVPADGVLGAIAQGRVHCLDVGDGFIGGRPVIYGSGQLGSFPAVATRQHHTD